VTGGPRVTPEAVAGISFPLFGPPPSWEGDRSFGAGGMTLHSDRPNEIHSLELVHGWREDRWRRSLAVRSTAPDPYRDRYTPHVLADGSVEGMLWEIREVRAGLPVPEDYVPVEFPLTISVDGKPRISAAVEAETWWMALYVGGDASIRITAKRFAIAEVELVRISDFRPYFEDLRGWIP
jgi:hypothetical protein